MFPFEEDSNIRHEKIRRLLNDGEPLIAVLLAAADFEWTIRRAIIALGDSSNMSIRSGVLKKCSGLGCYKSAWNAEVKKRFNKDLLDVIENWHDFKNAFDLRHHLIHGLANTVGQVYAKDKVENILNATSQILSYANKQDVDLYSRLPIRREKLKSRGSK